MFGLKYNFFMKIITRLQNQKLTKSTDIESLTNEPVQGLSEGI